MAATSSSRSPSHFVQLANATDFNTEVGAFMRDADKTWGTIKPRSAAPS